jgi:hypothetical protein
MPYTGIVTGVPTSTSYVPPDGVGSWKGIVHTFVRAISGGYIRSDSEKEETKQKKYGIFRQNSAFLSLFHITAHCDVIVFNPNQYCAL